MGKSIPIHSGPDHFGSSRPGLQGYGAAPSLHPTPGCRPAGCPPQRRHAIVPVTPCSKISCVLVLRSFSSTFHRRADQRFRPYLCSHLAWFSPRVGSPCECRPRREPFLSVHWALVALLDSFGLNIHCHRQLERAAFSTERRQRSRLRVASGQHYPIPPASITSSFCTRCPT